MLLNCACVCPTHQPQSLQKITLPWLIIEKATHGEEEEDMDTHSGQIIRKLDSGQKQVKEWRTEEEESGM